MNLFAFILSLFLPGLGHVLLNRYWRGTIIFFLCLISLDLALILLPCISGHTDVSAAILIFVGIIYFYSLYDIIRIVFLRKRTALTDRRKTLLKDAICYYLNNDSDKACKSLAKILHFDRDDVEATFYLAMNYKLLGNSNKMKGLLDRCYNLDASRKWAVYY